MRDMSELPLDKNGNGDRIRTLEYDIADAPMLAHAMMIAANTAMMCGGGKAENRLHHYKKQFLDTSPAGAKHLRREEDLCDIAIAMAAADTWSIHRSKRWSSDKDGEALITVGNRRWETWKISDEAYAELVQGLVQIAPCRCERIAREDEIARAW